MSAPYAQQVELADLLTAAGLRAKPEVPRRYTPPVRYVLAASPWLEAGQTVGAWRAQFLVVCVAAPGENTRQMTDLGDMVREVIIALRGSRFSAVSVDQPGEISTGAGTSLGAAVNVATALSRAEFEGA